MKDRRALIVLVLFVAIIGGIIYLRSDNSSSGGDEAAPSPEPVVTTTSTTATPASDTDFDTAVRKITKTENELFSNPNSSRVGEIMLTECSCYGDTKTRLDNLTSKGWHVEGDNIVVKSTTVITPGADSIEGIVSVTSAGKSTVDKAGKSIESSPTGTFQPLVYVVKKGQDGVWRVSDRHLPEEIS